ncbi:MAG: HEAT repeat domain-containing protein [Nitrospiraceae bacterium]
MTRLLTALTIMMLVGQYGCAASNASAEGARTTTRQSLQNLLAAEEHVATAEELQKFGPDVPTHLIAIAQDPDQDIAYRARATSYLGYYQNDPKVEAFLGSLVKDPKPNQPLLRRGLIALARVSKGKATSTIAPHLQSTDTLVREAAAHALVETDDAGALKMVQDAATHERESFLKKKMTELADRAAERRLKQETLSPSSTSEVESTRY